MEGIVNNMYYVLDSSWESRSWMFSPHTHKKEVLWGDGSFDFAIYSAIYMHQIIKLYTI